jgi:SAM-dependent methyltransferase
MSLTHRIVRKLRSWVNRDIYRKIYESHAAQTPGCEAVGAGDYDLIGRIEFDLLRGEGLAPGHTLLDLGCGNGRLAVHVVPYLSDGAYIGVDISPRLLAQARERVSRVGARGRCRVTWQVQASRALAQPAESVDVICAFSVFTHIEHEDTYRYLVEARRVVRPGGKLVFSCLPLELAAAKQVLREQATLEFGSRWAQVRNVVTSRDLMSELAGMAGWRVERWYAGDEYNIPTDAGGMNALGQSSCVLRPTPAGSPAAETGAAPDRGGR